MRKRGEALANRYRVEFIDTTGDIVMPDIPEPEHRKQAFLAAAEEAEKPSVA